MSDLNEGRDSNRRCRVAKQSLSAEAAEYCAAEDSSSPAHAQREESAESSDEHQKRLDDAAPSVAELPVPSTWPQTLAEVLAVAFPLMISAGMMSIVLFADRYLLGRYDGVSMGASMAGGNLFWVLVCVPIGAASMTGAVIGQLIGSGQTQRVGRLLWQVIWLALMTIPWLVGCAYFAEDFFRVTGQADELLQSQVTYMRWLMIGGLGLIIESALSGFFSGIERTRIIMWVSVASALVNLVLDGLLIFGLAGFPRWGIAGAAIGSSIAFWFKVVCYVGLLSRRRFREPYGLISGCVFDWAVLKNFVYFSLPSGLLYLSEGGAFTIILLKIGQLGDVPLRATTMAVNFNMLAYIPLLGIGIATSVLVGRNLLQSGPSMAVRTTLAALGFALAYSGFFAILFLGFSDDLVRIYQLGAGQGDAPPGTQEATQMAMGLMGFIACYLLTDSVQLVIAAALKGAGDIWFVLGSATVAGSLTVGAGIYFQPQQPSLQWWWYVLTVWIWVLAILMSARFISGRWKSKRMV